MNSRRPRTPRAASSSRIAKSPWGYYALAEAPRGAAAITRASSTELAPIVARSRAEAGRRSRSTSGMLLPHLGFAYQELGPARARRWRRSRTRGAWRRPIRRSRQYLVGRQYRRQELRRGRSMRQGGVWPTTRAIFGSRRLQARALRHNGKADQGAALLEESVREPTAIAAGVSGLAQFYGDIDRGPQAIDASSRMRRRSFPPTTRSRFELGATFDRAEAFCRRRGRVQQVDRPRSAECAGAQLSRLHARGARRAARRVGRLREEGARRSSRTTAPTSTSLRWAYSKADKLDLAEDNLKQAPPTS